MFISWANNLFLGLVQTMLAHKLDITGDCNIAGPLYRFANRVWLFQIQLLQVNGHLTIILQVVALGSCPDHWQPPQHLAADLYDRADEPPPLAGEICCFMDSNCRVGPSSNIISRTAVASCNLPDTWELAQHHGYDLHACQERWAAPRAGHALQNLVGSGELQQLDRSGVPTTLPNPNPQRPPGSPVGTISLRRIRFNHLTSA